MKKLILFFAALCCMVAANAQTVPPDNEIWYTTTDGNTVGVDPFGFSSIILYNIYEDGKGVIKCRSDISSLEVSEFQFCPNLQTIDLPRCLRRIPSLVFGGCSELTTVRCNATDPPSLNKTAFNDCDNLTKIIVPDGSVAAYKKAWAGFADKIVSNMDETKKPVLDELNKKKNSISNSEYIAWIDKAIADINAATSEQDAYDIYNAVLERIEASEVRVSALADIQAAMQGEGGSAYLNSLISGEIDAINKATNAKDIPSKKEEAIAKLNAAMPAYKAGKAEAFGTLGTQQSGPAVEVTDQNGNVLKLYNPKGVTFVEQK